ncbi:MAG: hypothetical protein ACHQD8_00010 [Chitinophagales bacterium]
MADIGHIKSFFKGHFLALPAVIQEKLFGAKAFVFDWDGVFNSGVKDENGSSPFNEVDAMGTNLLRFNHYLRTGSNPFTAIISGEMNKAAFTLAKREHFEAVYYCMKNKKEALSHLCATNNIFPEEVVYFFDDVLDLSIAEHCGLRIMVGRGANPLLLNLVQEKNLADYITAADGGNNGLREASELLMGLSGRYDDTIMERVHYTEHYRQYIVLRNTPEPSFYTTIGSKITAHSPQ